MFLKKMIFIISFLGFGLPAFSAKPLPADSLDFGAIQLQSLNNSSTTLQKEFSGELLLLDFWASWCDPCKESLPFYEKLQARFSAQGLQVVALSVDDEITEASDFVAKSNFKLNFLWDRERTVAKSLGIQSIPTTLIIDKNGKILRRERGFLASTKAKLEERIQDLLKNPGKKPAPAPAKL